MKRLVTLHLDKTRLTPELVEVLRALQEQYERPELRWMSDGLGIYVKDWGGLY